MRQNSPIKPLKFFYFIFVYTNLETAAKTASQVTNLGYKGAGSYCLMLEKIIYIAIELKAISGICMDYDDVIFN